MPSGRRHRGSFLLLAIAAVIHPGAARAPADDGAAGEFPDSWYYYRQRRPVRLRAMEGVAAPELHLTDWIGDAPSTAGKVVVVDFWGTWCGPCMRAIHKNNELVSKYGDQGLVLIGVHSYGRGWDKVPRVVSEQQITYPVAQDERGQSARAWTVSFWPTYAVLDRKGVVRAVGLDPGAVEGVVRKLLAEPAAPVRPEDWLEGTVNQRRRLDDLLALDKPPPIVASGWINGQPPPLEQLTGKVVLLDFWTPSRPACVRGLRGANALFEEHAGDGLVVIAVCHSKGGALMSKIVERLGVKFPVCLDTDLQTIEAYCVDTYPDYFLIDRTGALRIADCSDDSVRPAVEALLAEPAPPGDDTD